MDRTLSAKDEEKFLSRVQNGKVGDRITLRVLNRVGPKLCLITTEGVRDALLGLPEVSRAVVLRLA